MAAEAQDSKQIEVSTQQVSPQTSAEGKSREQYRTPDEEMATEFGRLLQLFEWAVPRSSDRVLFARLMNEASAKGLSWVEGLEYVTEKRRSAPSPLKR